MAGLTRVPAPDPSFHRRAAAAGVVLVAAILALAIEPWGQPATATTSPSPAAMRSAEPPMSLQRIAGLEALSAIEMRTYEPGLFGDLPSGDGWSLRTDARGTPLALVDRTDDELAVATGPVIDLGPADELGGLVITGPVGATIDVVRLWRFEAGRDPERLEVRMLPPPWPVDHAWAIGLRVPGASPMQIGVWRPGRYRLDLLLGRDESPRAAMLVVGGRDTGSPPRTGTGERAPSLTAPFRDTLLDRLPLAANVWTFGSILSGWARPSAPEGCRLAAIWRMGGAQAGCRPVQSGPTTALGVNLADGQRVTGIALSRMDPASSGVVVDSLISIGGRPGLAALATGGSALADGTYRMTVTVDGGRDLHWYIEVGPEGRRTAAINAFVTGYQR